MGNPPARSTFSNSDYWTGTNTLDNAGYKKMYCPTEANFWWLSSPSSDDSIDMCTVDGLYACFGNCTYDTAYGVCPLVSLKSSFVPNLDVNVKIQIGNTITEITPSSNLDAIYGQKVVNYAKNGDNTTYRIFYIDFEGKYGDPGTIYLKADYDGSRTMNLNSYASFDPSTTLVKEMNPDWAKTANRGTIASSNWNINEQVSAYMCTPTRSETGEMWSSYYDSTKANYVIASPSIEMYCD